MKINFYILKKLLSTIIFIWLIVTFIIVLASLPNDFKLNLSIKEMSIDSNVSFTEIKNNVTSYYKTLLSGSLGYTRYKEPVLEFLKLPLKKSIVLLTGSIIMSIILGIIKGVFDSRKRGEKNSTLKLMTTIVGLSLPDFFIIMLIQASIVVLGRRDIRILPLAGYQTAKHAILPIISLSIIPTMYIARITATAINKIYGEDYIRTALGKGSSRLRIIWIHALRNAIVEVVDSFSSVASILISSLIIVEYFFLYPGLALTMYTNYNRGDSGIFIGASILICSIYLIIFLSIKLSSYILNSQKRGAKL